MPLSSILREISQLPNQNFSRERLLSLENKYLATDCSGVIHCLKEIIPIQNPFPESFKASDIFEFCLEAGAKKNIFDLRKNDLIVWRKQNIPSSGDTGHVCILMGRPVKRDENHWSVQIFEVSKEASGSTIREIILVTEKDGVLMGVQWHPSKKKVKRTKIIAFNYFKTPTCDHCLRSTFLCLCDHFPKQKKKFHPLIVIREPEEANHPHNSVDILGHVISNIEVIDGIEAPRREGVLLYPNPNSTLLTKDSFAPHLSKKLIVLDGTWRKANKIFFSNPHLRELPSFHLPPLPPSIYYVRKFVKKKNALSTLEAYFQFLNIVYEDEEKKYQILIDLFKKRIDGEIKLRELFG